MPSTDLLISLREKLINIVSGSDRAQALNFLTMPHVDHMDGDLAAELSDFLHQVLSSGLTEHGEKVDYTASKWFAADFSGRERSNDFVLSHLSEPAKRDWLMQQRDRIFFRSIPYDWSLNSKAQTAGISYSAQDWSSQVT